MTRPTKTSSPRRCWKPSRICARGVRRVEEMINETLLDLDQVADFPRRAAKFEPKHDDKLKALMKLLKKDRS